MKQFKAKALKIKPYSLFLRNISKDFTIDNMRKQGWKDLCMFFSVDYNIINTDDILDITKYLMKIT